MRSVESLYNCLMIFIYFKNQLRQIETQMLLSSITHNFWAWAIEENGLNTPTFAYKFFHIYFIGTNYYIHNLEKYEKPSHYFT